MNRDDPAGRTLVMGFAVLVEGGLVVAAQLLGWLLDRPPLERFAFDATDVLLGVAATLPLVLLFLALVRWPVGPMVRIRQFSLEVVCPLFAPCTVYDLAAVALLAGVGEEMLFRGVIQGALTRGGGPWVGLAIASALFGLLHAVTPAYAILAALMGAYLGWLWQVTNNLLTPIIVHALYDFAVLLYLLVGPGQTLWVKQASAQEVPADAASDNP